VAVQGAILIGTSGWHYPHWKGPFYPEKLPARRMLIFYAERFTTVEINNSFYRLPSEAAFRAWAATTPPGFTFAVKGSRFITHNKKLKDADQTVPRLISAVAGLGLKLGPILFQLPPAWGLNLGRLAAFLEALPAGSAVDAAPALRYAFEFRNESWFDERVYELLATASAAFCIYDLAGRRSPLAATAAHVYVRLHGPGAPYEGSYDDATLAGWAERMLGWAGEGRVVYCYFDNDQHGYAVRDALRLRALVEAGGVRAGGRDGQARRPAGG
jgi:uncharacterized protein YecE (DUF72 family)